MAYGLSFSQEFFSLPNETNGVEYPHGDEPYSVYGALKALDDDLWNEMVGELFFESDPEYITIDMVMGIIHQTNTCSNLTSPVEVWIDDEGYYTVDVYEANGRPTS
jgi:hypothetical protein